MVIIAMLAAVSFVLMFFAFPVLPAVSFMRVDFSEIPILLGTFILGPLAGIGVAVLRSILHLLSTGFSIPNMIGDLASFLASIALSIPVYLIYKKKHTSVGLMTGLIVGVLISTVVMAIANYSFILPVYAKFAGFVLPGTMADYIFFGVLPFNLIKGVIVNSLFFVVYKSLAPWLNKKEKTSNSYIIKEER
ncbi:ECF transporter S component [Vagococcus xieshaowenii]|uniref:Riboflavin transporter n=2 Tax=Vagococcus xieshaowenii TaxID=2562451 RepID=A0AAJ5EF72_9ENTE|nr:ECF transporter S component [Vagococcus xieshaowenii]TFZ40664.1 ECF transporter S component [Vagococcus xieshaowenii]